MIEGKGAREAWNPGSTLPSVPEVGLNSLLMSVDFGSPGKSKDKAGREWRRVCAFVELFGRDGLENRAGFFLML